MEETYDTDLDFTKKIGPMLDELRSQESL